MEIQDSKELIPVERFAEQKGMDTDKVIRMIKDGFYSGKLIEGQWYVDGSESTDLSRDQIKPPKRYGKIIVTVMYVLGWIGVAVGSISYFWSLWSWIIKGDSTAMILAINSVGVVASSLLTVILALLMRAVFDIAKTVLICSAYYASERLYA
ncbi:hypothetical protein [Saccharospirillum mangrovi]|uniref:hypothetical protein n=1 Tax=Saccharospirillum mangrovi TaxID=2161747 RepID=UPI000D3A307C|nr:hypothetical protein [Saccharospirillum mangrovi]